MKAVRSFGVFTSDEEVGGFLKGQGVASAGYYDCESIADVILRHAPPSGDPPQQNGSRLHQYREQQDAEEEADAVAAASDDSVIVTDDQETVKGKKTRSKASKRNPFGSKWENFRTNWMNKHGAPAKKEMQIDARLREQSRGETTFNEIQRPFQVLRLKR